MLRTLYQAPVSFWHQIPIFSLTGEGGMVSGRFKCITLIVHLFIYIHYHYISSTSDHQPLDMGNWGPVLYGMFSLVIYFIYVHSINSVYVHQIPQFLPPPPFSFEIHMFVLYVWVSISVLQIGLSIPLF